MLEIQATYTNWPNIDRRELRFYNRHTCPAKWAISHIDQTVPRGGHFYVQSAGRSIGYDSSSRRNTQLRTMFEPRKREQFLMDNNGDAISSDADDLAQTPNWAHSNLRNITTH